MKKKILALSLMAICLAVGASGTFAFFTTSNTAHNVITTGSVKAEIEEKMLDSKGEEIDYPKDAVKVMPGKTVSKIVRVENTGTEEAWIRATVEPTINTSGSAYSLTIKDDSGKDVPIMEWHYGEMTDVLGDGWSKHGDFYYYAYPVAAGDKTTPIFDRVTFSKYMNNDYQGCSPELAVQAFAIQVKNNPIPEGKDVTAVWPDNVDYETGEVID